MTSAGTPSENRVKLKFNVENREQFVRVFFASAMSEAWIDKAVDTWKIHDRRVVRSRPRQFVPRDWMGFRSLSLRKSGARQPWGPGLKIVGPEASISGFEVNGDLLSTSDPLDSHSLNRKWKSRPRLRVPW